MDSQVKRQGRTVLRHRGRGIKHEAACAGERLDEKASVDQHGTERSQRTGEMGAVIRVAMEQGAMAHNVPLSGSGIAVALLLSMKLQFRLSQAPLSLVQRENFFCGRSSGQRIKLAVPVVDYLVFVPLELLRPMKSSGRQKKDLVFFVQGSLSHLFTLILFEPTRRGQTLGRWNVDPVYAALLWTGCSCVPVLRSARQALVRKAR